MKQLWPLFSASKMEILYILYRAGTPIHLRGIQELSGLSLRPIQLAVQDLTKKKILRRTRRAKYVFYELQTLPKPLRVFFNSLLEENRMKQQEALRDDAKSLGPFQEEAFRMLQNRK